MYSPLEFSRSYFEHLAAALCVCVKTSLDAVFEELVILGLLVNS